METRTDVHRSATEARDPAGARRSGWKLELDLSGILAPGAPGPSGGSLPTARVAGYLAEPPGRYTVAVSLGDSEELPRVDPIWEQLVRRRLALTRSLHLDERGRAVLVLTVTPGLPEALDALARETLVLPVRTLAGGAELEVEATEPELEQLEHGLRAIGIAISSRERIEGPASPGPAPMLTNEDWAFLGLIEASGAYDGPGSLDEETVIARLGVDPHAFRSRRTAVEHGLRGLVSEIFGPEAPAGAAAPTGSVAPTDPPPAANGGP